MASGLDERRFVDEWDGIFMCGCFRRCCVGRENKVDDVDGEGMSCRRSWPSRVCVVPNVIFLPSRMFGIVSNRGSDVWYCILSWLIILITNHFRKRTPPFSPTPTHGDSPHLDHTSRKNACWITLVAGRCPSRRYH